MILHALHDLYDRLEKDDAYDVAPEGYSMVSVSFLIELDPDGTGTILDHRVGEGTRRRGRVLCVPGPKAHSNAIHPFPFRDTSTYLLGFRDADPNPENTLKRFEASRKFHRLLAQEVPCVETEAVRRFFENWDPAEFSGDPKWFLNSGVFRLRKQTHYVHEIPEFIKWWQNQLNLESPEGENRMCLITGKMAPAATTHTPPIGGNMPAPAQAKATIVSFNFRAAESYGNDNLQGLNSPVSSEAATRYCKSLNALLASDRNRLQIGDATTVFWTETPTLTESIVGSFLAGNIPEDEDEDSEGESGGDSSQATNLLASLQEALRSLQRGGTPTGEIANELGTPFYILGLTGQAGGRIGVRFWHRDTVGGLLENLARHHSDLAIVRPHKNKEELVGKEFPTARSLLNQTAREEKNQPATSIRGLVDSILRGTAYPESLAQQVINRIRADREIDPCCREDSALATYQAKEKAYLRAALLKAWLLRIPNLNLDIPMIYQSNKPDPAYRLGALFALLEKTQQDALGDVNAGIRDRYYASASATPASVFPRLLRTYGHHLSKAASGNKGYQIYREREVQNILAEPEPMGDFPSHLNLREQGLFAIGYYHKRKDLWTKKDDPDSEEPDPEKAN